MAKRQTQQTGDDEVELGTDGGDMETEGGEGLVVDLGGVSTKYVPIPRGVYDCEVDNVEFTHSQRSGNPMWTVTLTVQSDAEGIGGRKLFTHLTFNEAGLPRAKRFLAAIRTDDGVEQELLGSRFNPAKVAEEGVLIGARCRARVDIRRYEGENRNDVKGILPPAEAEGGFTH